MTNPSDKLSRISTHFRLALVMLAAFTISFSLYVWTEKQVDLAYASRLKSFQLAQELRQSSDDLTRMVRTYIVTGNVLYKQHYQEILDIRDGKRPRPIDYNNIYWDLVLNDDQRPSLSRQEDSLLDRMRQAGFIQEEFAKLAEAKANSDALTHTEFDAMAIIEALPVSIEKRDQAISMLHNTAYHQAKAGIMQPIAQFNQLVDQRTLRMIQQNELNAQIMRIIFILTGISLVWLIFSIRRNVHLILGGTVSTLHDYISRIGNGDFSNPIFVDRGMEKSVIGLLAETQNKLKIIDAKQKQAELVIQESEERFDLAITGANDGLWDRNLALGTIYYSPRWKAMLGFEDSELENTYSTWASQVHPEDVATVLGNIDTCIAENRDRFQHEYRMRQKSGQYLWVLDRGMIKRNPEGKVVRLVGIQTDISPQKYVEKMKNEFISTVSHELRTPLTSIHGSLHLLEAGVMGDLPAKAHEMVKVATKNSQRLINLVNEILDIEKLMSGMMVFHQNELNINAVIDQAVALNTSYATSFGVRYMIAPYPEQCTVIGDADRLIQVITNLLSNAAKFSHHGGVVNIRLMVSSTHARIEVEDHGNGIPLAFRSKIFGEFSQADGSNSKVQNGAGLGLHISKKMIEKMKGDIGYNTEIGKGTTFWFTVPLKIVRVVM